MIKEGDFSPSPILSLTMKYMKDRDLAYLHRLCVNIKNGNFSWQRYKGGERYFGREIAISPVFCSYGQIGFCVYFPYQASMPDVHYDWEMEELTIDEMDWNVFFQKE